MVPQQPIIDALSQIGAVYKPGDYERLGAKNPIVVRQLSAMQDRIDADATAGRDVSKLCDTWAKTWMFWLKVK